MAAATNSVTTTSSLSTLMRTYQTKSYKAANFGYDEWNELESGKLGKDFNLDAWSTRQVTVPLDLKKGIGAQSIVEGGYEARPSSPALVDAALTFIMFNKRITFSRLSQILRSRSKNAFIENDLKHQGMKAVESLREQFARQFYGSSTSVLFLQNGAISTDTVTLDSMYGVSGLGSLTSNRRCTDLVHVDDYVAFLNPSGPALRTAGIVKIDSIDRDLQTITGSAFSDVTTCTDNDLIVFANNNENTTLAGGTEYNLALTGMEDMMTASSLYGITASTYPDGWTATADTSGGRFTPVKFRKMRQAIQNKGPAGSDMTDVWMAQGVYNDLVAQQEAGRRFGSGDYELDGMPSAKGVKIHQSRFTPDGRVYAYDKNNSVKRGQLFPGPDDQPYDEQNTDKLQDVSGFAASLDFPVFLFTTSRGAMAYASNATQQ
jgi:hypothetical protein